MKKFKSIFQNNVLSKEQMETVRGGERNPPPPDMPCDDCGGGNNGNPSYPPKDPKDYGCSPELPYVCWGQCSELPCAG